ncbi:urea carboxylase [Oxalobacteraceae bacterium GrIS 1.18]
MFKRILIANRGEIACRIIRSARAMGISTVAVYSESDIDSLHVREANIAVCIGPGPAAQSYLSADAILAAASASGADAIHPGYGFMSENAGFAERCAASGIVFIGPTPDQMRNFGLKHTARELAQQARVPLLPGTGLLSGVAEALEQALGIGYPVMLKSTAGGGGIGMRLCHTAAELQNGFASVQNLSANNFNNNGVYLEKYVQAARHIEVQIFGDGRGNVVSLGERDCSVQRRNQKVIEETPAPGLSDATRQALADTAVRLAKLIGYRSAGTVEYVFDANTLEFYFLEVNTRLQVEHGVTEQVYGIDLVEWMIREACGELTLPAQETLHPKGHAMQLRVYAEDPGKAFQPSSGMLTAVQFDPALRIDTWIEAGVNVSPFYDPLLAKIIATSADRATSIAMLTAGLQHTRIDGVETNLAYLAQILGNAEFQSGQQTTQMLSRMPYLANTIDVLDGGIQSTVQDYPGRLGLWAVGIPPSGPMDALAHRIANHLLGNDEHAPTLEMALQGATLRFNVDCSIALTGAAMSAAISGPDGVRQIDNWSSHQILRGETLRCEQVQDTGVRAYLAVVGGIDCAPYLGSRATFTLGNFGGHGGRAIRAGDVLKLGAPALLPELGLPAASRPAYTHHWDIAVQYGPHGAPDYFTPADIDSLFATDWVIHFNSSRTGVRLIGPKPAWARTDGGEAGLHPSNIHDNAYAIGAIDFTGDMPVILGPDGPSLGGFVCPAVIVSSELWKMGQLKPGDTLRFVRVTADTAVAMRAQQEQLFSVPFGMNAAVEINPPRAAQSSSTSPLLRQATLHADSPETAVQISYLRAGDDNVLIEFGDMVLDLNLRFHVQALMQIIEAAALPGVIDLTPGIRSLQVHVDHRVLPVPALLEYLQGFEARMENVDNMTVRSRIVHLPLAWNDSQTRLAIEKYQTTVRPDAPWCPSNIEFIRRINGLKSVSQVYDIVFNASYMVLGLGDVYLGAPVATPLDPRHRLVTTKYNPARTWTPENAVGIGGAYLCVYGMEGPGGYQFIGRTVQMWNRYRLTNSFRDGKPWLLRHFDQIRFYEVSEEQLLEHRRDFPLGRFDVRIEDTTFSLHEYHQFLAQNNASIADFKHQQQTAFDTEREQWRLNGQAEWASEENVLADSTETLLPPDCSYLCAVVNGMLWRILAAPGESIHPEQRVAIFETMKMEIPLYPEQAATVIEWLVAEGASVSAGQRVAIIKKVN